MTVEPLLQNSFRSQNPSSNSSDLEEEYSNNLAQKEYSVSEFSKLLQKHIENNFSNIKIKGEISGLKIATSGHVYFSLKDNDSVLACICWKYSFSKLKFRPEDGMQIIATGKITTFPGQSKYQLIIENIEADGLGSLMQILEKRKQDLQKEGLFDQEKKKKLPFLPKIIGVITSLSGVVIKDIIHRIKDRCPVQLIIFPVAVQGDSSAKEVASAVMAFNEKISQDLKPDIIIIARGGGSIEDLWSFNEEIVVRAIAASKIPIISAIGHESDFTLADFAADLRAPTPTAAAEIAVPVLMEVRMYLHEYSLRLDRGIAILFKLTLQRLDILYKQISSPINLIYNQAQKLDHLSYGHNKSINYLINNLFLKLDNFRVITPENIIISYNKKLELLESKISHIISLNFAKTTSRYKQINIYNLAINTKQKILIRQEQYININQMFNSEIKAKLSKLENQLNLSSQLIESLDYKNILKRGYAILYNEDNKVITSVNSLTKRIKVKLQDGTSPIYEAE